MWEAVKKSGIVLEKRVNLGDDPPVANKVPLQRVEWSSMLSPKDYFYPKLVRYFYCNLHKHDPFRHCFAVSYIRGYRMNLTAATLAQVLHLPIEGTEQDFTDEQKSISRLVSQSVVNDLICARAVGNWQPRSSDLNFDCKGPPQHCQHQRPPIGRSPGSSTTRLCICPILPLQGDQAKSAPPDVSFMLYSAMDSKNSHTCPYPASITALLEEGNVCLDNIERQDIKAWKDKATLMRMKIKLPLDQWFPLEADVARAFGSRTSAYTYPTSINIKILALRVTHQFLAGTLPDNQRSRGRKCRPLPT